MRLFFVRTEVLQTKLWCCESPHIRNCFDLLDLSVCVRSLRLFSPYNVPQNHKVMRSKKYKACSKKKKDRTFAINNLLLILQHFKQCPFQRNPLYWRHIFLNVSSIVGMFPGTCFLCRRAILSYRIFLNLLYGLETASFQSGLKFEKQEKSLLGAKSGE